MTSREEKLEQIRNCKHVFARISDPYFCGSDYRESVNECILCGTTNKNMYNELYYWRTYGVELSPEYAYYLHELDSKAYLYHLLGRCLIGTNYPYIIYQAALKENLVPEYDGSEKNEEIIVNVIKKMGKIAFIHHLDLKVESNIEKLLRLYDEEKTKEYKKIIK